MIPDSSARRGDKERATVPRGDGLSATRPPPKDDKKAGNDGKETEEGEVRYRGEFGHGEPIIMDL